jgi:hypothetical protein
MFVVNSVALSAGLPLRAGAHGPDHALAVLVEGLDFKLARLLESAPPQGNEAAWVALVDDILLLADNLGFPSRQPVTAHHREDVYMIVLEGVGFIYGYDLDRILGRLLYTLDRENAAPAAEVMVVLDQNISTTLTSLIPPSIP